MAKCALCVKGTVHGHSISHAHNVTNRTWKVNLQKVRASINGTTRRIWVCTRCLRNGMVQKPPVRRWKPETDAPTS